MVTNNISTSQFKDYDKEADSICLPAGDKMQEIDFAYLPVAGRQDRWKRFFICPECGKRKRELYLIGGEWQCASCGHLKKYRGIQYTTRGGFDEISYRMRMYGKKIGIQIHFPFDYLEYAIPDPPITKKRIEEHRKHMKVLQSLQNMRNQALFFGTRYNAALFRQVTSGRHPLMKEHTLQELRTYLYDWKNNTVVQGAEAIEKFRKKVR